MIDQKYCSRSLDALTREEKILEVTEPKVMISVELFQTDYDLARTLNINLSRILRLKFHEWITGKVMPVDVAEE